MKDAVKNLVYTSADDCRVSLPYEDDLNVLRDALAYCLANEEKTKAKYIQSRIRQLEKNASNRQSKIDNRKSS